MFSRFKFLASHDYHSYSDISYSLSWYFPLICWNSFPPTPKKAPKPLEAGGAVASMLQSVVDQFREAATGYGRLVDSDVEIRYPQKRCWSWGEELCKYDIVSSCKGF